MVPVVYSGTDDDHALAFGGLGSTGPLPGKLQDRFGIDTGKYFLPGGSVSRVLVAVVLWVVALQTSIHSILSHDQVVNRGNLNG